MYLFFDLLSSRRKEIMMEKYTLDVKEMLKNLKKNWTNSATGKDESYFVHYVRDFINQTNGIGVAEAISILNDDSFYDKAIVPEDTFVHVDLTVDAPDVQSAMDALEMLIEIGSYQNAVHGSTAEDVYGLSKNTILQKIGWIVSTTIAVDSSKIGEIYPN